MGVGGSAQGRSCKDSMQYNDVNNGQQRRQAPNSSYGQGSGRQRQAQSTAKSQGNMQQQSSPKAQRPRNNHNAAKTNAARRQESGTSQKNKSTSVRQASQQREQNSRSASNGADPRRKNQTASSANQVRRPSSGGGGGRPRKNKKKKKGKIVLLVSVLLVLVLGTSVAAAVGVYSNRISGEAVHGILPDEVKTPTWEGADVISGLICGLDYDNEGADGYSTADKVGRTDMILYVRYDTKNNKATLMQIPRDTYVGQASELKDSQGNSLVNSNFQGKINQVYFTALDKENRMAALARVINQQFDLPVDFYVTIDMDALKEIVDIKGWIEVYVPMDIVDPDHPTTRLNQGWQNLTGEQVEFLLRNRYNPGYNNKMDIARLQTQQSFYSALFREFKTLQPKDLMMWMNVLTYRCKTDLSITQMGGLAQKALGIDGSNITFIRPACGTATTPTGVSVISLVKDDTANLLNQYLRDPENPVPASELGIKELTFYSGTHEADVKTMADVQATEPEPAA